MVLRQFFLALIFLLVAWPGVYPVANYILAVGFFYFLFRGIIIWVMKDYIPDSCRRYLIQRFNIFLIIHGFIFVLLSAHFNFDYLVGVQDPLRYDLAGRYLAGRLLSAEGPITAGLIPWDTHTTGRGYMLLVGVIYYFFNCSVSVAVSMNVFFVVSSSILLYLLLHPIFGHSVAKRAMYLSAFFPLFFVIETALLKACFLLFAFLAGSVFAYRVSHWMKLYDLIMLLVFGIIIYNIRFIYVAPLVCFGLYYWLFINRSIKITIMFGFTAVFLGVLLARQGASEDASILNYINAGAALTDQATFITQANPWEFNIIFREIVNHGWYYILKFPRTFLEPWLFPRIYNIPFLSPKYAMGDRWLLQIVTYLSAPVLWLNFIIGLSGLRNMVRFRAKDTAIIWIPLLVISLILTLFPGDWRYMWALIPFVITCISVGYSNRRRAEMYFLLSCVISAGLIVVRNENTVVIEVLLKVMFLVLVGLGVYYCIKRLHEKRKKFGSLCYVLDIVKILRKAW